MSRTFRQHRAAHAARCGVRRRSRRRCILDEPLAGLAPSEVEHAAAILGELKTSGVSVVLIEHQPGFVFALCDAVTVLDAGEVVATGPAAAVREDRRVREVYLGAVSAAAVHALELSSVSAGYGRYDVVRGVDLHVADGEAVALLGANGAGKTTTLRRSWASSRIGAGRSGSTASSSRACRRTGSRAGMSRSFRRAGVSSSTSRSRTTSCSARCGFGATGSAWTSCSHRSTNCSRCSATTASAPQPH